MGSRGDIFKKVMAGLYSTKTALIYGRSSTPRWDFNHHVVPPLSSSTTYRLDSTQRGAKGFSEFANKKVQTLRYRPIYIYDRLDEPTRGMFEETLCFAERGQFCVSFATGMAAIAAAFGITVRTGEEVICHQTVYGCTYSLLTNWFPRYQIGVNYVDLREPANLETAISDRTRVVYFETPVNPTLDIIDIAAIQKIVKRVNARRRDEEKIEIIVDNTFSTPFCQRPLEHGADLVVHSLTKGIGGFGTDMGGAVIGKSRYEDSIMLYRKDFGGALSPKVAWTIMAHGLPTLVLRMRRQQETAARVVEFLSAQKKISRVRYPGMSSDPDHAVARRQMADYDGNFAPGSIIYFEMSDDTDRGARAADTLCNYIARNAYSITLAVSLGQIRTLIESPALMTHSALGPEELARRGIVPGGVRLSIGLEEPGDIIRDLAEAFDQV